LEVGVRTVLIVGGAAEKSAQLASELRSARVDLRVELLDLEGVIEWSRGGQTADAAILDWDFLGSADAELLQQAMEALGRTRVIVAGHPGAIGQAPEKVPNAVAYLQAGNGSTELAAVAGHALCEMAFPVRPRSAGHSRHRAIDYLSALQVLIWSANERLEDDDGEFVHLRRATLEDLQEMADLVRALGHILVTHEVSSMRPR
jgi:hypothetical protein